MNLAESTILVTGASSGLGAATTEMVLAAGGDVVAVDVNADAARALLARLDSDAVSFVKTDVTDEASVSGAISAARQGSKPLRGVVNCAGVLVARKTLGKRGVHDLESFNKVMAVNVSGTFNVARLAAEAIAEQEPGLDGERGVIVMTSSVAAFDGQIGQVGYAASKGAVASMTLPLARDLAASGIRVMTVAPGVFETPMIAGLSDEARASLGAQVPFPSRLGKPAEYATLVRQIIENRMLNGEVIRLDGAIRMAPK